MQAKKYATRMTVVKNLIRGLMGVTQVSNFKLHVFTDFALTVHTLVPPFQVHFLQGDQFCINTWQGDKAMTFEIIVNSP